MPPGTASGDTQPAHPYAQPAQPYGQPAQPYGQQPGESKPAGSKTPIIIAAVVAVVIALAAVAAFLWPGFLNKETFNADSVANGVARRSSPRRARTATASPTSATRPAPPTSRSSRAPRSPATVDVEGEPKTVTIEVTGDEKNDAEKGNYTVGLPN